MKKCKRIIAALMVAMMVILCGNQNLILAQSTSSIVITAQPQNYVGKAGEINYFEIAATGTGLTYQWEMSKNGGSTWEKMTSSFSGYNTNRVGVTMKSERNGWKFRCVVTDKNGNQAVSNAAEIKMSTVNITKQPQSYTGKAGEINYFEIAATGTGLTYQWEMSKNGGSTWEKMTSSFSGYNTNRVGVTMKSERNGWKFRCVVTDKNGNQAVSNAATINIIANEDWELPIM